MRIILKLMVAALAVSACAGTETADDRPVVAVTYSVLGSVVSELVGDAVNVQVIISDGTDPHNFEPSAKDIETINNAALVVANGLDLEEGLEDVLASLPSEQVFFAGEHITVRSLKDDDDHAHGDDEDHAHSDDEDHSHGEGDHAHGGTDPHLWLSPFAVSEFVDELGLALESALGVNLGDRTTALLASITELDEEIDTRIGALESCELVTGHEALGYFADRYGCELIGAVIPSLTTSAEASASQLAELKELIAEHDVKAIFTDLGTPQKVAEQVANETGVPLVEISTHVMGDDDTYASFMNRFVDTLVTALS
jgi:zinc/manganese transport system substrate-binding protein